MAREWDAHTYASLTLPHVEWGRRVLDRMRLRGDERVLDAGCGTGRDAVALLERWPGLDVVALDGSEQMLRVAREQLGDRVTYVHADLTEPLPIEAVDAVMSVAAFHWVADHDLLFTQLARTMRGGARLTSDCGGRDNVANLDAALERVTGLPKKGVAFAGAQETWERLERAGFEVEDVRLRPDPFRIDDPEVFRTYLAAVCLGNYLVDLDEEGGAGFVEAVAREFDEPVIDYVRLEIDAVRR